VTSPAGGRAGSDIGTHAVVATDGFGTRDTAFAGTVSLALVDSNGAIVNGRFAAGAQLVATASAGQVTFGPGLMVEQAGQDYRLRASSGSLAGDSDSFDVTASRLLVNISQSSARASQVLSAVTVQAIDERNMVDTAFSAPIALTLRGGNAAATLGGTASGSAVAGEATFTTLRIDRIGQVYQLRATGAGLTVDSLAFNITADRLVFVIAPITSIAGLPLVGQPRVIATDGFGNIDTFTTYSVTISLAAGSLSGTTTLSTISGVAQFGGISIAAPGAGYQLRAVATAGGSAVITSDGSPPAPFDVLP
jgi:hypothetical protein